MGEYDDIFRKLEDRTGSPVSPNGEVQPEVEMEKMSGNPKNLKWILILYVLFQALASVFYTVYQSVRWADSTAILQNFSIVEAPTVSLGDSGDSEYPYEVTLTGVIRNDNDIVIPSMYISVILYDADGNEIDSLYVDAEYVAPGEEFTFSQIIDYSVPVYSSSVPEYGFSDSSLFRILLTAFPTFLCLIAFFALDREGFRGDTAKLKRKPGMSVLQIFSGFFMVLYSAVIGSYLLEALGAGGTSANQQAIQSLFRDDSLHQILLFLLLVVITPVVEEAVFRKVVFGFLEPRIGPVGTILVSGAIFGLAHTISAMDFLNSIPYIFMGFALGFVYWWSKRNIWVSAGAHALNNLVSFALSLAIIL